MFFSRNTSTQVHKYTSTSYASLFLYLKETLRLTVMLFFTAMFFTQCDTPQQATATTHDDATQVELRREPFCAKKENGNCTEIDYVNFTYDFEEGTPTYPDCHFQITMLRRVCTINGKKFIDLVYTGPVAYFASDPDCDGFSVSSSTDIINELIQQAIMQEYSNPNLIIPDCAQGGLTPQVNYYRSSCTLRCFWEGGEGKILFSDEACGLSCCKNEILVCKNSEGKVQLIEVNIDQPIDPCLYAFYPDEGFCPPNSFYSTSCEPRCGSILNF